MKRKFLAVISSAILPLFSALCFAGNVLGAHAESTPPYWEGAPASGAIVKGEDCPVVVEQQTLDLNIASLPRAGKVELSGYHAEAVAEYTFSNPTHSAVNMTLLFPFGVFPSYVQENTTDQISNIFVDGKAVEQRVRYSYAASSFDADKNIERVLDDKKTDAFYCEDTPVTRYCLSVSSGEVNALKIKLAYNHRRTRVVFPTEGTRLMVSGGDTYAYTPLIGTEQKYAIFYAVGAPLAGVSCAEHEEALEPTTNSMTFSQLALLNWSEETGVSESDWYNAAVDMLNDKSGPLGSVDSFCLTLKNLIRWYEYDMTIPAGESVVNRVKAPLYPTVEGNKNPRYEYSYLLSPAARWGEFKKIEIRIRTPYLLLGSSLDFIQEQKGDGESHTYSYSRSSLPQGELTFVLTETGDGESDFNIYDNSFLRPSHTWAFVTLSVLASIAGAITIVLIVSLKRSGK